MKTNKEKRFLDHLIKASSQGRSISRKQARVNHRLGNPSATILRLVEAGWKINRIYTTHKVKTDNGKTRLIRTVKYSLA